MMPVTLSLTKQISSRKFRVAPVTTKLKKYLITVHTVQV